MTATILRGDARNLPLADASVDLIVTSPPYWSLRSYTDGGEHYGGQIGAEPTPAAYIDSLIACTREWVRVLKPSGSLWVNLGDKYNAYNGNRGRGTIQDNEPRQSVPQGNGLDVKDIQQKSLIGLPWRYAIRCIDDLGLILRAEVIWSKPNGLPESVTDRVRRSHETWFHLVKSPRYFAAVDTIREAHVGGQTGLAATFKRPNSSHDLVPGQSARQQRDDRPDVPAANPLGKLPGSVWTIATQPLKVPAELGVDHFAAYPMEWPRRIIQGWSPHGGRVIDPFGGTGTTALVADVLGRHAVSVDMSADYCRLAAWRTTDPGQRATALEVEKPRVEQVGQLDLFSLTGEGAA